MPLAGRQENEQRQWTKERRRESRFGYVFESVFCAPAQRYAIRMPNNNQFPLLRIDSPYKRTKVSAKVSPPFLPELAGPNSTSNVLANGCLEPKRPHLYGGISVPAVSPKRQVP